jgi:hypothetical protein
VPHISTKNKLESQSMGSISTASAMDHGVCILDTMSLNKRVDIEVLLDTWEAPTTPPAALTRRGELYSRSLRKDRALLAISPKPFFLAAFSKLNDSARAATDCPALFLNSAMASRVSNSSSKS